MAAAEQMSLTDILSPPKGPATPPPLAETPAATPKQVAPEASPAAKSTEKGQRQEWREKELGEQGRAPDGTFMPKEPPASEAAPATTKEPEKAPEATAKPDDEMTPREKAAHTAMMAERRKRQELERRLAERAAQAPDPNAPPAKTFWDDPEGAFKNFEERQQQQLHAVALQTRLATSEMLSRRHHPDFDAKIEAFREIIAANPTVQVEFKRHPDPAEYAYQTGAQHSEIKERGGLEQWKAETEKALRAKIEKELKEKAETLARERANLPQSLSDAPSAAPRAQAYTGPTPLADILKR